MEGTRSSLRPVEGIGRALFLRRLLAFAGWGREVGGGGEKLGREGTGASIKIKQSKHINLMKTCIFLASFFFFFLKNGRKKAESKA